MPSIRLPPDATEEGCWCAMIPLINPDGPLRVRWDVIQVMTLFYVSLFVPARVAFKWSAAASNARRVDIGDK